MKVLREDAKARRIDELIANLCPEGVEFKELSGLLERTSNIRWQDAQGEEFKYIDLTSVDRNTHAIGDTETIDSETAPSRAQQIVHEGDVLFGTTRPMLKRYCLIPAEYAGHICSTGYCVLRTKTGLLLPNFLFHLLGTETFYNYVEANQRGASYPAITDGAVKAFRIPAPPLEVQREIVKVLDTFTQLEAELEARPTPTPPRRCCKSSSKTPTPASSSPPSRSSAVSWRTTRSIRCMRRMWW